jgi:hypothetical protein
MAAIVAIESGNATPQIVSTILSLIFALRPPRQKPPLTGPDLSPLQQHAVCAIASAIEDGRPVIYGSFMSFRQWGLPKATSGWRALASEVGPCPAGGNLP